MVRASRTVASKNRRPGPRVHVETIRKTYRGKVYEHHLLRSSYREGGKVKHRTHGNLSRLPGDIIDLVRRALRGERFLPASEAFEVCRSLPHGHVMAVLGTARRLGLETTLNPRGRPRKDKEKQHDAIKGS